MTPACIASRAEILYLATADAVEEAPGRIAQGMLASGDVHRDVRIDEDPHVRPDSISASI